MKERKHAEENFQNLEDEALANEFWKAHLKCNQSIIGNSFISHIRLVDQFHGQYKSQITCENCQKGSVRFEPFMNLTLEVPQSNNDAATIYLIRNDLSKYQVSIQVFNCQTKLKIDKSIRIAEICNMLEERFDIDPNYTVILKCII